MERANEQYEESGTVSLLGERAWERFGCAVSWINVSVSQSAIMRGYESYDDFESDMDRMGRHFHHVYRILEYLVKPGNRLLPARVYHARCSLDRPQDNPIAFLHIHAKVVYKLPVAGNQMAASRPATGR